MDGYWYFTEISQGRLAAVEQRLRGQGRLHLRSNLSSAGTQGVPTVGDPGVFIFLPSLMVSP